IWMELLDGRRVEEIVREHGPLPSTQIVDIASQLLAGLAAVHAAGIVHRDITARNVIVQRDGRVVLMDLGAASSTIRDAAPAGTPLYIAPELMSGAPATVG